MLIISLYACFYVFNFFIIKGKDVLYSSKVNWNLL